MCVCVCVGVCIYISMYVLEVDFSDDPLTTDDYREVFMCQAR